MYKTKICSGCFHGLGTVVKSADEEFNEWSKEHPDIEIIKFVYKHTRYGDHSIAILYKEDMKKEDNQ